MKPQNGPSSKKPVSLNDLQILSDKLQDNVEFCALVTPTGIQVQLFYDDYRLEKALYSLGAEAVDVTHIIYHALGVPQNGIGDFLQDNCDFGNFDVSGILYISPVVFMTINRRRALSGKPTFRYLESVVHHALNCGEYAEHLRFTPNWSNTIMGLSCISKYTEFLQTLAADFEVMEYIVCNKKSIENLKKFGHDLRYLGQHTEPPEYMIKSLVLFSEDVSNKRKLGYSAESNVVAEVFVDEAPSVIKIDAIEAEPDRFGRIRPVIASNEVTRYEYEFYTIDMLTPQHLKQAGYQVGDIVEVSFINKIPRLGKIIERTSKIPSDPLGFGVCHACATPFTRKHGQLYCTKIDCTSTVFNRMLHANKKKVLDLPFDWHTLYNLVTQDGTVNDLPSLFNLDTHKLRGYFDEEGIDLITRTLHKRIAQLNGECYSGAIQNIAQRRFLDALSVVGLHGENVKRLGDSLGDGDWQWSELPLVLTDPSLLRSCGISGNDVVTIVASAKPRIAEFDTLVREF